MYNVHTCTFYTCKPNLTSKANQSVTFEEKSTKGAPAPHKEGTPLPRDGSGFAHIKLELSALHWQQDSGFKML